MSEKLKYKSLSKRAKQLIGKEEGFDVDFKLTIKSISSDDLVAFANSSAGGAILVGVGEINDGKGQQKGEIVGCKIGDSEKLTILNKAGDCSPPVTVKIIVENINKRPFYRIEIPSSDYKPHSTKSGTYKVRGDGKNISLLPKQLLAMFLDAETSAFSNRFRDATSSLINHIKDLDYEITRELNNILRLTTNVDDNSEQSIDDIDNIYGITVSNQEVIDRIERNVETNEKNIEILLNHFGLDNWRIRRLKMEFKNSVQKIREQNPLISREGLLQKIKSDYLHWSQQELEKFYDELIN